MKKTKSFKGVLMILSLFISLSIFTLPVWAQDESSVTATVTLQNIAVSVSDGSIAYGVLTGGETVDTSDRTPDDGLSDTQTVTNDGNVSVNFSIKGADTTPGGWTLASTAGADQFVHAYCTVDCDTTGSFDPMTTSYTSFASGIAASGTQDVDLALTAPTSSSDTTQQTTSVTILVEAA